MTCRILCIIPPHIPSYFNAGHHIPIFLVSAYLRNNNNIIVDTVDGAALNLTWKEVCDILFRKYDLIFCHFDYDSADTCERFMMYKNTLSKNTILIAFGRLVKEIPNFFIKRGYDMAHFDGDYESGAQACLDYYLKKSDKLPGIISKNCNNVTSGVFLEPENIVFPNVEEIPYDSYSYMYKNDLNKFCGIPNKQELVVPIARGCPVGCEFCDVPKMQGKMERRVSVDKTISYIMDSFAKLPFDYFTFYAPTFTLNKTWVKEFCQKMIDNNINYKWKCVTVLKTLNDELLVLMGKAGCVRVSFGIESFDENAGMGLPKLKRDTWEHFEHIVNIANQNQIEVNCFLILGLPSDNADTMSKTIQKCLELGARVRPTIYTDYSTLRDDMSIYDVSMFNRQLFLPKTININEETKFYVQFYANKNDKITQVDKLIYRA
jgi:anaerobic magnesium-protoporphyrin IX monomethyl ester cyclase